MERDPNEIVAKGGGNRKSDITYAHMKAIGKKSIAARKRKAKLQVHKVVAAYTSNGFNKAKALATVSAIKDRAALKAAASVYFNRDDVKDLVLKACAEIDLTPRVALGRLKELMMQDNNLNVALEATSKGMEALGITGRNANVQIDAKDLETLSELANAWKEHVHKKMHYEEAPIVEGETK